MNISKKFKKNTVNIIYIFFFCMALYFLALQFIGHPSFWFDEAGQFWIAKGLHHFSKPFLPEGNLFDVIKQNNFLNQDPGGYSILLHYWSMISNNVIWLRSLSYLFFSLMLVFMVATVKELSGSFRLGIFSVIFTFLLPASIMLKEFAFELRAYSMEVCGLAAVIYFIVKALKENKTIYYLLLGLISAFFMTSRYSACPVAIIPGIIVFIMQNGSLKERLKKFSIVSLPVFLMGAGIYFVSLRYQNSHIVPPEYINHLLLRSHQFNDILMFFVHNFFELSTIFISIFIGFMLIVNFLKPKFLDLPNKNLYTALMLWVVFYELIFIILSAMGKYPWLINARWSIGLNFIAVLSFVLLISYFYNLIKPKLSDKYFLKLHSAILVLTFFIALLGPFINNLKSKEDTDVVLSKLQKLKNYKELKYYVAKDASPVIRYLIEYGPNRGVLRDKVYPNNFEFDYDPISKSSKNPRDYDVLFYAYMGKEQMTKIIDYLKPDYLIFNENLTQYGVYVYISKEKYEKGKKINKNY